MSDLNPAGNPAPTPDPLGSGASGKTTKKTLGPREIAGLVALLLLIVFIAENTRRVKIRFIIPEVKVPVFVALLVAALVGALVFWLIQHRMQNRKSRKNRTK